MTFSVYFVFVVAPSVILGCVVEGITRFSCSMFANLDWDAKVLLISPSLPSHYPPSLLSRLCLSVHPYRSIHQLSTSALLSLLFLFIWIDVEVCSQLTHLFLRTCPQYRIDADDPVVRSCSLAGGPRLDG